MTAPQTHPTDPALETLDALLTRVRACRICEAHLPLGPRPVLQAGSRARILIAGQAPGRKVHASGIAFDDASGRRLRDWLGLTPEQFYDRSLVALLPMGFCYPGTGPHGDLPPRPECAPAWRQALLDRLPHIELTLVLGQYAQAWHMPQARRTLTETVRQGLQAYAQAGQGPKMRTIALPHPSPRNNRWLKQNPWFEADLLPLIQAQIQAQIVQTPPPAAAVAAGQSR